MYCEHIDLYEHFGIERSGAGGLLTAYRHAQSNEYGADYLRPAMLVLPGGAYLIVSDREGEPVAFEYLVRGFEVFVLKYSVAPESVYPVQLREAAMAMAFIREKADEYRIDPSSVAAVGFSAGGHLCGCLGTMFASDVLADIAKPSIIRPDAVILSYPVSIYDPDRRRSHTDSFINVAGNDEKIMNALSLERCVTSDSSPAFLWHTMDDGCVPVYGSLVLAQKYNEEKVLFEGHFFGSGCHGLSVCTQEVNTPNAEARHWIELSVAWLKTRGFKIYS